MKVVYAAAAVCQVYNGRRDGVNARHQIMTDEIGPRPDSVFLTLLLY
jgi:hypothetical protein